MHPHAVAGLAEVHGAGIIIDFRRDFAKVLIAGKRVQDRSVPFHPGRQFAGQFVLGKVNGPKRGLIVRVVVFTLDSGHIERVELFD